MKVQMTTPQNSEIYRVELIDDSGRVRKLRFSLSFERAYDTLVDWRNKYLNHKTPLLLWFNFN